MEFLLCLHEKNYFLWVSEYSSTQNLYESLGWLCGHVPVPKEYYDYKGFYFYHLIDVGSPPPLV